MPQGWWWDGGKEEREREREFGSVTRKKNNMHREMDVTKDHYDVREDRLRQILLFSSHI